MNTLLWALVAGLLIAFLWMGWRYRRLRRSLDDYARDLRRAGDSERLPPDALASLSASLTPGSNVLGDIPSALNALIQRLDEKLTTFDAERSRLAAVLDQLTDGVIIADADGRAVLVNPAAARFFGPQAVAGKSVTEILRHHQLIEAWQRARQTGELQADSLELPVSRQYVQLVAIADRYSPGGTLILIQDLTRVQRLETVRRDFVSNVSHELRTPLASLKALTETLQEGALDDPPAARRFLERIEAEVDALTQMATELLELSRIESGQVPLELEAVQPCTLLSSSVERMRAQAERANLSLSLDCSADLPVIRADRPRLEQVLVNLLHNAIKFTLQGEVTASARQEGPEVIFSVRDTGLGISADDLPRIFERFYKTDRARSHAGNGGGTGLGLSIARHIVEAHGGRIWAESDEGRGSAFYFAIPAA